MKEPKVAVNVTIEELHDFLYEVEAAFASPALEGSARARCLHFLRSTYTEAESKRWLAENCASFPALGSRLVPRPPGERQQPKAIPGTGAEIFFPEAKPAYPDAVYEILITGVVTYRFARITRTRGLFSDSMSTEPAESATRDPFYEPGSGGRFEDRHCSLLINGAWPDWSNGKKRPRSNPSRIAERLEAERGHHRYRFLVDDPGEAVGIAFDRPYWGEVVDLKIDGNLTALVRALPPGTPTLKGKRAAAEKAQEDAKRAAEQAIEAAKPRVPPLKTTENDEDYRNRWCRNVERSSDDMLAFLAKVHEGRQKQMDQLDALKLDPEGDVYAQYKAEIENWTASQLVQFTDRRKGKDDGTTTIIG